MKSPCDPGWSDREYQSVINMSMYVAVCFRSVPALQGLTRVLSSPCAWFFKYNYAMVRGLRMREDINTWGKVKSVVIQANCPHFSAPLHGLHDFMVDSSCK